MRLRFLRFRQKVWHTPSQHFWKIKQLLLNNHISLFHSVFTVDNLSFDVALLELMLRHRPPLSLWHATGTSSMKNASPEFDVYIAKSAAFAKPILTKLRKLFHQACPAIVETMKWSFPHFEYKGIVGSMAAFKNHVSFGFWKGKLLDDPQGLFTEVGKTPMNASRLTDVSELPADKILLDYIRRAVAMNEDGVKTLQPKKKPKAALEVPDYFQSALKKNKKALATFEAFSPSHKSEYVEWIALAKQETTRQQRLNTAVQWLAEGKPRNWKHMRK